MRQLSELPYVLIQIILQYTETHKRLVIPQLGAFIVKVPEGELIFSELFRRDDGVLRGLLGQQGMSELEAAGAIDRFVFEVRHAMQEGGEYLMEGLGSFAPGTNGTILFRREAPRPIVQPVPEPHTAPAAEEVPPTDNAAWVSMSPKVQPDPSLKGLRYGRPQKSSGTYHNTTGHRGKRMDRFLIVAIIAAVIAVGAIIYVYLRSTPAEELEIPATEQIQAPASMSQPEETQL